MSEHKLANSLMEYCERCTCVLKMCVFYTLSAAFTLWSCCVLEQNNKREDNDNNYGFKYVNDTAADDKDSDDHYHYDDNDEDDNDNKERT